MLVIWLLVIEPSVDCLSTAQSLCLCWVETLGARSVESVGSAVGAFPVLLTGPSLDLAGEQTGAVDEARATIDGNRSIDGLLTVTVTVTVSKAAKAVRLCQTQRL